MHKEGQHLQVLQQGARLTLCTTIETKGCSEEPTNNDQVKLHVLLSSNANNRDISDGRLCIAATQKLRLAIKAAWCLILVTSKAAHARKTRCKKRQLNLFIYLFQVVLPPLQEHQRSGGTQNRFVMHIYKSKINKSKPEQRYFTLTQRKQKHAHSFSGGL